MKIEYQETTSDLQARIDIHNQYGGKDIDAWMLELLPLKPGLKILDVACGSGKQCSSYYQHLNGDCTIVGVDVSKDLLNQAKDNAAADGKKIEFQPLDFNKKFNFPDNSFNLVSCCFAIYYAEDIPFTISEMHRVLKPGGTLFTSGPMPENKKVFYDIIHEATNKAIPKMPGSSRYASEILDEIKKKFSRTKVAVFENPLVFKTADPFIEYTRASLSEDRKLWGDFFKDRGDFEKIMDAIIKVAESRIKQHGEIVMTKVVGGILATK